MSTYSLCLFLIQNGRTEGLAMKLNVFFAFDQLDEEEYSELMNMLTPAE